MSCLSESSDGGNTPERIQPYNSNTQAADYDFAANSDSSQDESSRPPKKRARLDTVGASSQSSSVSENMSQPESDNESYPSMSMKPRFIIDDDPPTNMPSNLSSVAERIMKKKGFVAGKGLGKFGQGRVDPIEASTQRGRMGLGFQSYSKGQAYDGPDYDPNMEIISVHEKPVWMGTSPDEELDRDILDDWLVTGPRKMTIDDETLFCNPEILQDILSLKTVLDTINDEDLRRIRSQCNPFEKIGRVFFVNRAALKMANIDTVFDYMFTNPVDKNNHPMVGPNELLYFADVCAGPGGFTEYVLWRKKWHSKGFGFTLKESNDFQLSELHAASTDTFFPYYGDADDGDIFNPRNLKSLKDFVLSNTDGKGVHFLMGDGGFAVEGQENIQEILSKQLYLCQCIAALSVVREGGNFVVKLFDVFTQFSIGLIYLMYRSFQEICIHKPNTSRPANSERYLICKGKRASSETIERHLICVNEILWDSKLNKNDVNCLVPLKVMEEDENFMNYIVKSNNSIGEIQKVALLKIIAYNKNPKMHQETRHTEMRNASLELWNVPNQVRIAPKPWGPDKLESAMKLLQTVWGNLNKETLFEAMKSKPRIIKSSTDFTMASGEQLIRSTFDWKFVFLNSAVSDDDDKFSFYLGCPGSTVFKLSGKTWMLFRELKLPADTLILAEKVQENHGEGRALHRSYALHVLDAFCLGGVCIFHEPLKERYDKIRLFCTALNKPRDLPKSLLPLRCKKLFSLESLPDEMNNLVERKLKNTQMALTTPVPSVYDNADSYYPVHSVLFIKTIKTPWMIVNSRSQKRKYIFNTRKNVSSFDYVPESILNTFDALSSQMEWSCCSQNSQKEDIFAFLMSKM